MNRAQYFFLFVLLVCSCSQLRISRENNKSSFERLVKKVVSKKDTVFWYDSFSDPKLDYLWYHKDSLLYVIKRKGSSVLKEKPVVADNIHFDTNDLDSLKIMGGLPPFVDTTEVLDGDALTIFLKDRNPVILSINTGFMRSYSFPKSDNDLINKIQYDIQIIIERFF